MKFENVVLITACGRRKLNYPERAYRLYNSTRIRYLYSKSRKIGVPFYILSAKHGLVESETIIEPYDEVMTLDKCSQLVDSIRKVVSRFNVVIYYKGGSRKEYLECIKQAMKGLDSKLIEFGYAIMGDINKLEDILYEQG